jgi:hypothetical protein
MGFTDHEFFVLIEDSLCPLLSVPCVFLSEIDSAFPCSPASVSSRSFNAGVVTTAAAAVGERAQANRLPV